MHPRSEMIGWLGFVLIVCAYLLLTLHLVAAASPFYHLPNLLGAVCMAKTARQKGATPLLWLNLIWALIAMVGLLQAVII